MARVINKINYTCRVIEETDKNLVELEISEGAEQIFCENNKLTELIVPEGVKVVFCGDNELTELILPSTVTALDATNNPNLKKVTLPERMIWANLDTNTEVINLKQVSKDKDMVVRFIPLSSRENWRESTNMFVR